MKQDKNKNSFFEKKHSPNHFHLLCAYYVLAHILCNLPPSNKKEISLKIRQTQMGRRANEKGQRWKQSSKGHSVYSPASLCPSSISSPFQENS